eukprot:jgi/Chrzof1/1859/Cz10g23280.t1
MLQLLSTLDHPNIIAYKDSFLDQDGALCIVTTFCDEGDMFSRIKARAAAGQYFSESEIMDYFIQVCGICLVCLIMLMLRQQCCMKNCVQQHQQRQHQQRQQH